MNTLLFSLKKPYSCARLSTTVVLETVLHVQERDSFSSEFWRRELYGSSLDFSVLTAKWQQDDPQKLICSTHEVKVGLPGMPCLIKAVSRGRCCEQCQELAKTGVGHVETVSGSSHQTYLRNK